MAEAGFTKGPWTVREGRVKSGAIVAGPYAQLPKGVVQEQIALATIADFMNSEAERDANARLIAAAPDLYEALKLARAYLAVSLGSPSWDGENPYPVIDAALAKAEGV